MLIAKLFLFICFVPLCPILYALLRSETKPRKNLILGVTLPYLARDDAAVRALTAAFLKAETRALLILLLVSFVLLFLPWFSVFLTAILLWLIPAIVVPYWIYGKYNRKLCRLKKEMDWTTPTAGKLLLDTGINMADFPKTSRLWFLLPVVISLAPCIAAVLQKDLSALLLSGLCGPLVCILFWGIHGLITRQAPELVDSDTHRTAALTRLRRRNWDFFCLACSWLSALYCLTLWLFSYGNTPFLLSTAVYGILILFLALWTELHTRSFQHRLTLHSGSALYADEDALWLFGLFYCNPNDTRLTKNDRVGMGISLNLARPAGKAILGFCALLILLMPLFGVWIMAEEFSPLTLTLEENTLIAAHSGTEYVIDSVDITSIELLEELPALSRRAGTAMDTVCKGKYTEPDSKDLCLVCLDPSCPPFLRIETAAGLYYLADRDSHVTLFIWDALKR